jgi:hypothetical protein
MRTCQPDAEGRIHLGNLVAHGDTWAVESATADRIQLVRMKVGQHRGKESLADLCSRLGNLGFVMPPHDYPPISGDALE